MRFFVCAKEFGRPTTSTRTRRDRSMPQQRKKVFVEVTCAPPQEPHLPELRHELLPTLQALLRLGLQRALQKSKYPLPYNIEVRVVDMQPHLPVSYQIVVGLPDWKGMRDNREAIKRHVNRYLRSYPSFQTLSLSLQAPVWSQYP